ncbi:MAG: hypothetical protein P8M03_03525 [Flavobacteriaceae bacterium]|nr:hypothetical protein [Flavobacteriaceae bacterium]
MKKSIFVFLLSLIIFSCGNPTSSEEKSNELNLEGFYERIGIVELVNFIPVDTILTTDGFRQTKFFSKQGHMWMNNDKFTNNNSDSIPPWGYGGGIYGAFEIKNDSLYELVKYGFGHRASFNSIPVDTLIKYGWEVDYKNKLMKYKVPIIASNSNEFLQVFGNATNGTGLAEYYVKTPEGESSALDGIWKREGTIEHVNEVPVDTIFNSMDDFVQYKIYYKGKAMFFTRDFTADDPSKGNFYGGSFYGNFTYKDNVLTERIDYAMAGFEEFHKNLPDKDENGTFISFDVDLKENSYSQKWGPNQNEGYLNTSEYFVKIK